MRCKQEQELQTNLPPRRGRFFISKKAYMSKPNSFCETCPLRPACRIELTDHPDNEALEACAQMHVTGYRSLYKAVVGGEVPQFGDGDEPNIRKRPVRVVVSALAELAVSQGIAADPHSAVAALVQQAASE